MVEKFGKEKADEINQSKALTLDNFIRKYGEIEGKKRFISAIKNTNCFSPISQELFNKLDYYLGKKYTTYYATKMVNIK